LMAVSQLKKVAIQESMEVDYVSAVHKILRDSPEQKLLDAASEALRRIRGE
jgi:hypothetical protein